MRKKCIQPAPKDTIFILNNLQSFSAPWYVNYNLFQVTLPNVLCKLLPTINAIYYVRALCNPNRNR